MTGRERKAKNDIYIQKKEQPRWGDGDRRTLRETETPVLQECVAGHKKLSAMVSEVGSPGSGITGH